MPDSPTGERNHHPTPAQPANAERQRPTVIVWGLAAGIRTTQEAARGALAWREYPDRQTVPREDWQVILFIRDLHADEP